MLLTIQIVALSVVGVELELKQKTKVERSKKMVKFTLTSQYHNLHIALS